MFQTARIKLTAWYLIIIMTLTLGFSAIVYSSVSEFTARALEAQKRRFRDGNVVFLLQRPEPLFSSEVASEIKERTLMMLGVINVVILGLTGGMGYILAGKTLNPIEKMVSKQKRFISDAAHEIKTPLTVMKANLEVSVRDPKLSIEDAKEIMKGAISEVDSLHNLSEQLLIQSKYLINGTQENSTILIDTDSKLKQLVDKYEVLSRKNGAKLVLDTQKNLYVKVNETSFEVLIRNLIDNAIKYGKEGNVITLRTIKSDKYVRIEIQDTGNGIPEEDLPYIFDPFYKADKSRTKIDKEGAGLGLSICKEIVKNMHGEIKVKSILGAGTAFTINLPISEYSQ